MTARRYIYSFGTTETPLSDGGNWVRPASGVWNTTIRASGGNAQGDLAGTSFNDTIGMLAGTWGQDFQSIACTVTVNDLSIGQEFELHVCMTDDGAGGITTYEVDFISGGFNLVKWLGAQSQISVISNAYGLGGYVGSVPPSTGDVLKVTAQRVAPNWVRVQVYQNGTLIGGFDDNTNIGGLPALMSGAPAIAFDNLTTLTDVMWQDVDVTAYDLPDTSAGATVQWPSLVPDPMGTFGLLDVRSWAGDDNVGFVVERWVADELAPAAGGTGTSVNPGAGTLAITGFAPTIAQPQTANPAVGSLAITGFAPSVVQNTKVNPGVGSIALTGFAPTITQPQTAAPGAGSLAISGFAPTVAQPQTAAPGAGSVVLTGFAPTVAQPQTANPAVGSIVLTGFAPTIAQPQTAAPGAGSITFTGYAPTVTQASGPSANPGAGLLAITGYAPSILQPQTSAPGAGALTLTGFAPTVVQNSQVSPGAGSVVLTGFAPTVAQSDQHVAVPDVGLLAITGYAPTVAQSVNQFVAPAAGAVAFTGYPPTVAQAPASPTVTPSTGLLSITGYAPTVVQAGFVNPIIFGPGGTAKQRAKSKPAYNPANAVSVLQPKVAPPLAKPAVAVRAPSPAVPEANDDEAVITLLATFVAQGFFDHG